MNLPVDGDTITAWSRLLNLTEEQAASTLEEIERDLRVGYEHRPASLRHLSFEELIEDMGVDELALMFLVTGLRQAGHHDAAHAVEIRGLVAQLQAHHTTD